MDSLLSAWCRVAPDTRGTFLQYQLAGRESNDKCGKSSWNRGNFADDALSRLQNLLEMISKSEPMRSLPPYRDFHLILHPRLVRCSVLGTLPTMTASIAARKSLPLNGISLPPPERRGRLSSNCPR